MRSTRGLCRRVLAVISAALALRERMTERRLRPEEMGCYEQTCVKSRGATSLAWFAMAQSTSNAAAGEGYAVICDGRTKPKPGAVYSAVGHVNYGVGVGLQADISIPGGCEVNLPIEVWYATPRGI